MTLSPAAVVRDAWALARRDGGVLAAIAGPFWFLPAYALALLGPVAPTIPATATLAARAAATQQWVSAAAPWYLLTAAIGLWGQASVFAFYLDRERPAVGAAIGRGLRLWPRLALASALVGLAAGAAALLLTGLGGKPGMIVWMGAMLYVLGRALQIGPALAAERPLGALGALARALRLTRGQGLALAGVAAAISGAGLIASEPLLAIDGWLRGLDGGNPVALAIVDAAAAGVSAAVALASVLAAVAAYRRLVRPR